MGTIKRFEDIKAWQEARNLVKEVYLITNKGNFRKDFSLREQIQRASISTLSNIAEGYARNSTKEFLQFLNIARGSLAEVQSQLYVAVDLNYINKEEFGSLYKKTTEIASLVNGFIRYLKGNKKEQTAHRSLVTGY
jgi:four helix bundle protein